MFSLFNLRRVSSSEVLVFAFTQAQLDIIANGSGQMGAVVAEFHTSPSRTPVDLYVLPHTSTHRRASLFTRIPGTGQRMVMVANTAVSFESYDESTAAPGTGMEHHIPANASLLEINYRSTNDTYRMRNSATPIPGLCLDFCLEAINVRPYAE